MKKTLLALGLLATSLPSLAADPTPVIVEASIILTQDVALTAGYTASAASLPTTSVVPDLLLGKFTASEAVGQKVQFAAKFTAAYQRDAVDAGWMKLEGSPSSTPIPVKLVGWSSASDHVQTDVAAPNATLDLQVADSVETAKLTGGNYTTDVEISIIV
ncbi:TPA: hypothetical protein PGG59_005162 [Raoultella planticola]|nr:hypothetical protein [Raoultella planticola]